ncbi:hypothetical protein N0V90_008429 [Kalmusia sp. IMI 367209]|nr:hypothetical protein N0V90_008429 [Kalmusia sp. IMI 367209]
MSTVVKYENPIVPGFAPDPSVVLVDSIYYLVTSSFHIFPGIPIYASEDLQSWKLIGHGINRSNQLSLENATTNYVTLDTGHGMAGTGGLYAPTIRHHDGIFYIVCTNCISFPDGTGKSDNFIISTKNIWSGDWSDPMYFPFKGIDPDLYFDDDGRAYVQGSWRIDRTKQPSCTIKQYEIDIATGSPLEEPREIWGGFARYDTEGPHIYKKDRWYYLLVAEGGTFEHHMLSIARSQLIQGPYETGPANPVMTADRKKEYVQNVGHGEIFQDVDGQWWAAVLGLRDEAGWPLGRETFLTPVSWPEGEWPTVDQPRMSFDRSKPSRTDARLSNKTSSPVTEISKVAATIASKKANREDAARPHNSGTLEHVYIRNVDLEKFRFNPSKSSVVSLSPTAGDLTSPRGSMTFLGMRQRTLQCSAKVTLDTPTPESSSTCDTVAGFSVYKDHLRHASITYATRTNTLSFNVINATQELSRTTNISIESSFQKLRFEIRASPKQYVFMYQCEDAEDFKELGSVLVTELFARDFTGPIFGIFAQSPNPVAGWINFSDFEINTW